MPLFAKTRFTWCEPRSFRRAEREAAKARLKWWHKPAAAILFGLMIQLPFWIVIVLIRCLKLNHHLVHAEDHAPRLSHPSLQSFFLFMLCLGACLIYVIPWFFWLFPSTIRVFDNNILLKENRKKFKLDQFHAFYWSRREDYLILTLVRRNRPPMRIGAPLNFQKDDLSTFLCSRGLNTGVTI